MAEGMAENFRTESIASWFFRKGVNKISGDDLMGVGKNERGLQSP